MKIFEKESKLLGLTLKQVSERIGISSTAIYMWMNSKGRAKPRPENITKLKALGFSDTACLEPYKDIEV